MTFKAPIKDMLFNIEHLSGWSEVNALPPYGTLDLDDVSAVLTELGRFCTEEIAPLNRPGDEVGSRFKDGKVIMALDSKLPTSSLSIWGGKACRTLKNLAGRACRALSGPPLPKF